MIFVPVKKLIRLTIPVLIAIILLACPTFAADDKKPAPKLTFTTQVWNETGTNRNDYTMYHNHIIYGDLRFRYDFMDVVNKRNYSRYWLAYGNFVLAKSPSFELKFYPEIMIMSMNDQYYYGGNVLVNFPKLGLNILQRSFAGNKVDKYYTWANLKLCKFATLQYYRHYYHNYSPDAYLGPKITLGDFNGYYGFSTARPGARVFNLSATFKF